MNDIRQWNVTLSGGSQNYNSPGTGITFAIAQDEQPSVAEGNVTAHRSPEGEKVVWCLDTPERLKIHTFETAVRLLAKKATARLN